MESVILGLLIGILIGVIIGLMGTIIWTVERDSGPTYTIPTPEPRTKKSEETGSKEEVQLRKNEGRGD